MEVIEDETAVLVSEEHEGSTSSWLKTLSVYLVFQVTYSGTMYSSLPAVVIVIEIQVGFTQPWQTKISLSRLLENIFNTHLFLC